MDLATVVVLGGIAALGVGEVVGHLSRVVSASLGLVGIAGVVVVLMASPHWTDPGAVVATGMLALLVWHRSRREAPGEPRRVARPTLLQRAVWLGLSTLALALLAARWAFPVPYIASVGGPFDVGTSVRTVVDSSRSDIAYGGPGGPRRIRVQLWYPASRGSSGAAHTPVLGVNPDERALLAAAVARSIGVPPFVLRGLRDATMASRLDAPIAPGAFPLILFSPGLKGLRTQSVDLMQRLASAGYIVAALDHPGDAVLVILEDGVSVPTVLDTGAPGTATGNTMWDVTRARSGDLVAVQQSLVSHRDSLAAHIDTTRIFASGHSAGAAAAALAFREQRGWYGAVLLDGMPRDTVLEPSFGDRPLLFLMQGQGALDAEAYERYRSRATAVVAGTCAGRLIELPRAAHLSFTDAPLYLPPVPRVIGSADQLRLIGDTVLAFLDRARAPRSKC